MPRYRFALILATALAPALWGTTYLAFTDTLPVDHPLLVGALRALPAGILLMLLGPGLPPRNDLVPLIAMGFANIGLFFGLLFVAAQRLPGGVAATVMSTQPLIVALIAWPLFKRRPHPGQLAAAIAGVMGVALLILDSSARLDVIGLAAALAGAASMACGTLLIKRFGSIGSPLALTAWQLTLGGLVLLPFALVIEGVPPVPSALNLAGLTYLVVIGTAFAYWLWVRGIARIGADVTFLVLLSPLVATILGATLRNEWFAPLQLAGIVLILAATAVGIALSRREQAPAPQPEAAKG